MTDPTAAIERLLTRASGASADPGAQDALWRELVEGPLRDPVPIPFAVHWDTWRRVFANRPRTAPPPPAYVPAKARVERAHATALMRETGAGTWEELHRWSATERDAFWSLAIRDLAIPFEEPPTAMRTPGSLEDPEWLPGARLNIADACFGEDPSKVAIVVGREGDPGLTRITHGDLEALVNRVANGVRGLGLEPGDAVSLYMPMTVECVAAYLGIIRAGGVVISIADSFAPPEIATRNRLGNAKAIITTSAFMRGGKTLDLYAKVRDADATPAIVLPAPAGTGRGESVTLREGDMAWADFLGDSDAYDGVPCDPQDTTNILFSSGTTGDPKAIPWTHLTPIKAAADGRYHQDIHADDVVAWPTSIGWMMGPWLIYASLVNGATMALYEGAPTSPGFTRFVEDAGVTVLGVVPAIVRAWRTTGAVAGRDWSGIRVFSSTGEASNVEDYLWLMHLARYDAPVIEYCGGTEIGGGHLTGSVVQPQSPAVFSTPALGLDFVILDEAGQQVRNGAMGEIFLIPPSIGLSQRLLNRDHHEVYHEGTPPIPGGGAGTLRRHGDEVERLPGGYYQAHGRADDTMNLGGIKVSSLELERVMDRDPLVYQTAAVAVAPEGGGADRLVVFVVLPTETPAGADVNGIRAALQARIKSDLNPLFRIHEVVAVEGLPRTASNKIMRRELRNRYRG